MCCALPTAPISTCSATNIVEKGYLPKERAEDCENEYRQAAYAYEKLIGPHVDRGRAKKVFDRSWLRPTVR